MTPLDVPWVDWLLQAGDRLRKVRRALPALKENGFDPVEVSNPAFTQADNPKGLM